MQQARFVFAAVGLARPGGGEAVDLAVMWMLMSPNNRPLGQAAHYRLTYQACQDAVRQLQAQHARLESVCAAGESNGQWSWRVELDGTIVAVSSRAYLRLRECNYNLDRFLTGVPEADIIAGARTLRGNRDAANNTPVRSASTRVALRPW